MSGKPTYPAWIPDNSTNIVVPPGGQVTAGWLPLQKPPSQYFNWFFNLISQWVNFTGPAAPTVIVGSAAYCTHATLAAAVADSGVGNDIDVLVTESYQVTSTVLAMTKSNWRVSGLPGVSITAAGGGLGGFSCQANGIEFRALRFVGFATAITGTSAWTYGRVTYCNFSGCTTDVDTSNCQAGKIAITEINITE